MNDCDAINSIDREQCKQIYASVLDTNGTLKTTL